MFSLNMLDYPMFFLSLSTWTWKNFLTLRSNFAFYLNPVLPPRPSKIYWVDGGWYGELYSGKAGYPHVLPLAVHLDFGHLPDNQGYLGVSF